MSLEWNRVVVMDHDSGDDGTDELRQFDNLATKITRSNKLTSLQPFTFGQNKNNKHIMLL